jgi:hypothetical protein
MRIWLLAAVIGLLVCACSESTSELSPEDIATVRAAAFSVACLEVLCPGEPILPPDTLPDDVRDAIQTGFSDEVEYVSEASLEAEPAPMADLWMEPSCSHPGCRISRTAT